MYMVSVMQQLLRVLAKAGVNPDTRVRDLTDEEVC